MNSGERFRRRFGALRKKRAILLGLSAIAVFITAYALVLPASTLDKDTAQKQGGIDVTQTTDQAKAGQPVKAAQDKADQDKTDSTDKADQDKADKSAGEDPSDKADQDKTDPSDKADKTDQDKADPTDKADQDKADKDKAEQDKKAAKDKAASLDLNAKGKGYSVSAKCDAKAKLPDNTKLTVKELDPKSKKYDSLRDMALTAVQKQSGETEITELEFSRFFDISLNADGDEVEPAAAVNVSISYDKALPVEDKENVRVVHFVKNEKNGKTRAELLDPKDVEPTVKKNQMTETAFEADSFSVFGVVYAAELRKEVLTASGDKFEVKVTYQSDAEIPEGAELEVKEIPADSSEYTKNVKLTNKTLKSKDQAEVSDPIQFDISIVSADGEKIEPKEGSSVNVEIRLEQALFETADAGDAEAAEDAEKEKKESRKKDSDKDESDGLILFNGEVIDTESTDEGEVSACRIAHIKDDGKAELIEDLKCSVEENALVMDFDTESFSDYLFDGNSGNGLYNLPSTIYVGDEIYMWNQAQMWVTNIGSVVTETKHPNGQYGNDGSNWKTVTAINSGTFRIYNNNYQGEYKDIRVLPARTGTTPPSTIDTVSNSSIGLKLDLFDYDLDNYLDDYFNNYNHGDNPVGANFLNRQGSINNGHNLKFWGSGIGNNHGSQNQYQEHGVTSIVKNTLDTGAAGGYPVLSTDNTSLSYLFTPSNGTDKQAYANADGLFKKDGDYYVYDSDQNYAWYNSATNRFEVYERTYTQKSGGENGSSNTKAIGFFPFHKWDEDYDLYVNWNKNLNHHFGMSMSVDFTLPKSPKAVTDSNGDPIVFEFSGDDDLWVFIDGKLAMDIGGIHQPTSGTINFKDKTVTVNGSRQYGYDFSQLYDGEEHTLQVFYIERGGCDSNCKIKFNLTRYGDVEFDKVDEGNTSEMLQGATFGLYKDAACTQPLMEKLNDNSSRVFVTHSDENGHVKFEDVPLGTYYLKEIGAPDGYPIDNTIRTVQVYVENGQVKTSISGIDADSSRPGVQIPNKKPEPIQIGLQKIWQNMNGQDISVQSNTKATFELKRIRSYQEYTETLVQTPPNVSKLIVGWKSKGQTHNYKEYSLISGTAAHISWSYADGYTGTKACVVNGTTINKDSVTGNIISEAVTMPAAGQTTTFYIVDDSETGEAVRGINVAGSEYIGNSEGGYIHTFETKSEPDTDFQYTGDENVVNNRLTLPINNSWQYQFTNLPVVGKGDGKVYTYSYYLEEVSTENPSQTTVIYKDSSGNVINVPSAAEMSTSGSETVINRIPTGYLQIDKSVTYNGESPVPDNKKADLAGKYTFKVYLDENCSIPYKVKQGETETELTLEVTIGNDGAAQSSDLVELPVGHYWIEEQTPSQTGVTPEQNRIPVEVKANSTTSEPAVAEVINNKDESDNPDELAIELEKTFTGLPDKSKIPGAFHVTLSYKVPGSSTPQTITLTGSTEGHVTCTKSDDGLTWHWRITHIPAKATDFSVSESNYAIAGYTRVTKINGSEVDDPSNPQDITVLQPEITMTNATSAYTTTDHRKVFTVADNQILLVRMTNHATVIVSQKSLSIATRNAIEDMIRDNGNKIPGDGAQAEWSTNFVYFSHEIQGDSFSYGGRTIYFQDNTVKIPHNASSHVVRVDIGYVTETAQNSFVLENEYTELPTELEILKVEKGKETTTHLKNAVFELRKLEDVAPVSSGGELTYVENDDHEIIVTSKPTGEDGKLTFDGLTRGVYEVREFAPPAGYILSDEVVFYFRVDAGTITYVEKGTGKPSSWQGAENDATIHFTPAKAGDDPENAEFRVGNEPGAQLPSSGGPGVIWMYVLGSILLIGSGVFLTARRRIKA